MDILDRSGRLIIYDAIEKVIKKFTQLQKFYLSKYPVQHKIISWDLEIKEVGYLVFERNYLIDLVFFMYISKYKIYCSYTFYHVYQEFHILYRYLCIFCLLLHFLIINHCSFIYWKKSTIFLKTLLQPTFRLL